MFARRLYILVVGFCNFYYKTNAPNGTNEFPLLPKFIQSNDKKSIKIFVFIGKKNETKEVLLLNTDKNRRYSSNIKTDLHIALLKQQHL